MISTIRGQVLYYDINSVVVECNGVGYEILVTSAVMQEGIDVGEEIFIYTYLQVSENGINLFGFASKQEKQLFEKLISVSGVGPKGAIAILSQLGCDGLIMAVATEDSKGISKTPGIGNKTAQKIILELKDKVDTGSLNISTGIKTKPVVMTSAISEVNMALTSLGFKEADCIKAIRSIDNAESMDAETLLALALRKLG